jgi:hypothetical protein
MSLADEVVLSCEMISSCCFENQALVAAMSALFGRAHVVKCGVGGEAHLHLVRKLETHRPPRLCHVTRAKRAGAHDGIWALQAQTDTSPLVNAWERI